MSDSSGAAWLRAFIDRERGPLEEATAELLNRGTPAVNAEVLRPQVDELVHKYYSAFLLVLDSDDSDKFRTTLGEIIEASVSQKMPPSIPLRFNISFRLALSRRLDHCRVALEERLGAQTVVDTIYEQYLFDFFERYQDSIAASLSHTVAHLDQAKKELNCLNAFSLSLRDSVSLTGLHMAMANSIAVLLGLDDCVLYLLEGEVLVQKGAYGLKLDDGEIVSPIMIPLGKGVVGTAAATAKSQRIDDLTAVDEYIPDQYPGRSELAVPVLFEGAVIGVFDSESTTLAFYNEHDQRLLEGMANIAAPRIVAAKAIEENEALLRDSVTEAENRNRFYHTLSHEIRTPLTSILSSTGILQKYGDRMSADERSRRLEKVVSASEMLNQLVGQILSLREARALDIVPHPQLVDVGDHILDAIEPICDHRGRTADLVTEFDLASPEVMIDPDLLYRIITNLVTNAVKYSRNGTEVRVEVTSTQRTLTLRVRDRGVGIPAKELELVFEDYYRATNRGSAAGAGLGLTIVRVAAARLGGVARAESEYGVGSTFTVEVPIGQVAQGSERACEDSAE